VPADETYPLLVQEFIDMSDGIPGIAEGPHDVRVLMTGHTIIGATLRQPAPGRLHSNVSQGGTERLLSYDEIPAELREIAIKIDGELDDFPRYYAIDFARGKQGWVLIEINKKPGLFREANGPLARTFMDSLAAYLIALP
jgi:glutathione synthase/RimK-type ligase-like ATP-grasp enzyme